jgi:hypothetical protein
MDFTTAAPAARYAEFQKRVDEELSFLRSRIGRVHRASSVVRILVALLLFAASVLPLLTQVPRLAWIPSWSPTLAIVAAGGFILFDRSAMWTEDFTRWNTRLLKTLDLKDQFDSRYARLVRLMGDRPDRRAEDHLLARLEEVFQVLGALRQEEADEWATRYRAVLSNLSSEIKGRGGEANRDEQQTSRGPNPRLPLEAAPAGSIDKVE